MGDTAISWTDKVWNPTTGCTRVSPGCKHCYAFALHDMRHAAHAAGKKVPAQYAKPFSELQMFEDRLDTPLSWRKPQRVFVNSMSDLFHKDVPDEFIDRVFATMALSLRHTFQVLTKRPERMQTYLSAPTLGHRIYAVVSGWLDEGAAGVLGREWDRAHESAGSSTDNGGRFEWSHWRLPLPNVWLGVSVEDQKRADERIPILLQTPAAVRFLSCEPLLGPVSLTRWLWEFDKSVSDDIGAMVDTPAGRLHWVIVGGESGPGARPFHLDWAKGIQNQCDGAGVPLFVKQLGSNPWDWDRGDPPNQVPPEEVRLTLKDKKGTDPAEFPAPLRVQEFPDG